MKARIAAAALALAACMSKVKPVRMPNGQQALRIECNYSFANCERRARKECDGDYVRVTQGDMSCADCGMNDVRFTPAPPLETSPQIEGNNVYKGVLYVRCR